MKRGQMNRREFLGDLGKGVAATALAATTTACPTYPDPKTVIFTLSDIQAYWLENEASELVRLHAMNNLPVTLGVIPEGLEERKGIPCSITENLRMWSFNRPDAIEIACHPYNHANYENWSFNEQVNDMIKSKETLQELCWTIPKTFSPAWTWGNEATPYAIKEAGLEIGINPQENEYLYHHNKHFDGKPKAIILHDGLEFGKVSDGFDFENWDPNLLAQKINNSRKPYVVVRYHQQDFEGKDRWDFDEFGKFLNKMREGNPNFTFMTARDYCGISY